MINIKHNSERFLLIYNDLDKYMRRTLRVGDNIGHTELIIKLAKEKKIYSRDKDDLIRFAKLRNVIVHNPDKEFSQAIAEPHDYVLKRYEQISTRVKNPPLAINCIAIKANKIFTITLDNTALEVMKIMNSNTYTHVPVVMNGRIVGVFSENTIFSYMVNKEDVLIEKEATIKEFEEFIPINKHESEKFIFVSKNILVTEVEELFQKELNNKKRLSVIFITETGKPTEKLLGLITAWDVAGYKE
ncbi:CBS domain-containing protein [Clostridium sp. DL1XJH146]